MPRNRVNDIVSRDLGPYRSPREVLRTAAGAPTTTVSTWEFPVFTSNSTTPTAGSGVSGPATDVVSQVTQLTRQLTELRAAQESSLTGLSANTQAVAQNTATKATVASSMSAGTAAETFLGGLGLSPILSGLFSLFGGNSTQVSPLVPFTLPSNISYQGAQVTGPGSQIAPVDYAQNGQPRTTSQPQGGQVNIQITAMDSKSFLDHSDDIAQAVRKAILNSNSLNDAINNI